MDRNFNRHVGYQGAHWTRALYAPASLKAVQELVRRKTNILVPESSIADIVDGVHVNYRPTNISPYTRYTQPPDEVQFDNAWQNILLQSAEIAASQAQADMGLRDNSAKLTRWSGTLYGEDVSKVGLRQFGPIKVRDKRPSAFQFHMRY